MTMTEQKNEKTESRLRRAIVKVGDGRGFMVEVNHPILKVREPVIITAAHCLPHFPPALGLISYLEERTYRALLGPLGAEQTVWAECLFADPIADIAVLGSPDGQDLYDEAAAYTEFMASMKPFVIGDAPKQGREFVQPKLPNAIVATGFWMDTPGKGPARLLSLDGQWIDVSVTRRGPHLSVDQNELVVGGMSGSPIVLPDGRAIGLISSRWHNPVTKESLPARFLRRRTKQP
jgi:hypothetical protein